jgi:protein subunit release factor B
MRYFMGAPVERGIEAGAGPTAAQTAVGMGVDAGFREAARRIATMIAATANREVTRGAPGGGESGRSMLVRVDGNWERDMIGDELP